MAPSGNGQTNWTGAKQAARMAYGANLKEATALRTIRKHGVTEPEARALLLVAPALTADDTAAKGRSEQVVKREATWAIQARDAHDRETAAAAMKFPPDTADVLLDELLKQETEPVPFRIDSLMKVHQNVLLDGLFKAGKSGLGVHVPRCYLEGVPFLGHFPTTKLEAGRVGIMNTEMEAADFRDYLRTEGAFRTPGSRWGDDGLAVWNLKGYSVPLLSDDGAERFVRWATEREVVTLLVDTWNTLAAWDGIAENDNDGVKALTLRLDQIKAETDLQEIVVLSQRGYMGEHSRGGSALPGWPDVTWSYHKDDDDRRYFKSAGRGVDVPEGYVSRAEDGALQYHEGQSRLHAKAKADAAELFAAIYSEPGLSTTTALAKMSGGANRQQAALAALESANHVRREGKRPKLLYPVEGAEKHYGLAF